jgi:NHL repeat
MVVRCSIHPWPLLSARSLGVNRRLISSHGSRLVLALTPVAFAVFAVAASPAAAAPYVLTNTFAGAGTNALSAPTGVAVDNSGGPSAGAVYVTDTATSRVEKFDSAGHFLLMFGKNVNSGTGSPNVCKNAGPPTDVCQAGTSGSAPGEFTTPTFIAVDESSGPSAGDVYVGDTGDNAVSKFDSAGSLIASWGASGQLGVGGSGGSFGSIAGIAVDQTGDLEVLNTGTELFKFAQDGSPLGSFGTARETAADGLAVDSSGNFYKANGSPSVEKFGSSGADEGQVTSTETTKNIAIDPTTGDLFVDNGNSAGRYHFNGSGEVVQADSSTCVPASYAGCSPTETFGSEYLTGATGIALNKTSIAYVANTGAGDVSVFAPVVLPKVTFGAVTNQTQTAGTLNANVDPNGGGPVTACYFEYGTDTSYSLGSIPCNPEPAASPPGSNFIVPTDVSASISGLTTEKPYHYRLVVSNANGTARSSDQTYLPHAVGGLITEPPTNVARNTATLNASFNGNGEDTHYYFEWGTTTSYGYVTATPPGTDAGSPNDSKPLSFELTGLSVETTYHYRIVASNAAGTSYGADQSFKTLAAVENVSTEPATNITATTATLNASYNGIGEDIHYYFEYGPDTNYGSKTAAPPGTDNGSPNGAQALAFDLSELGIDTTYHYRIVATDAAGTTFGPDQTFTTLGRYQFSTVYGSIGSGDGQLMSPKDVAVDNSSGDIYVADTGNHRVVKFDSSGHFLAAWGWGVSDGNAGSEVCTSDCQAGISGSGVGQFEIPEFIEVDNSGGPSAGDVYVADTGSDAVQKFAPSGRLISSWGSNGAVEFTSRGTIGGITVDTAGDLFVLTDETPYYWSEIAQDGNYQSRFNTSEISLGNPAGAGIDVDSFGGFYETQAGGGVNYRNPEALSYSGHRVPTEGNAGLTVDRSTDDLYVDQGEYIQQFTTVAPPGCGSGSGAGTIGEGCGPSDTFGSGRLTGAAGLAFNPSTGMLYAANTGADDLALFSPLPIPEVTTGSVTNPGPTSGTLNGHVDPQGVGQISDCYFQYGTNTAYSLGSVPCSPGAPLSSPTNVSAALSGLNPFTTYHYRLVAMRADGEGFPSYGRDQTFTPAPGLSPGVGATSSTGVAPTTATLSARINPNLSPTTYRFQYGTGIDYGSETVASESIGSDGVDHFVENSIAELLPATTYHYRVIAINFNGTTNGPDMTFTTPDLPVIVANTTSDVGQTTATLSAGIRPGLSATTYHLEYGVSESYGSKTPQSAPIGSDDSVHTIDVPIAGLQPETAYHYRVVATNAFGTTNGSDQTFTTASITPISTSPPFTCKAGFLRRRGKCVRTHHQRHSHRLGRHHRGSHK